MMTSAMYSSSTDEWATPLRLFRKLDDEFHFSIDVCADETNRKCDRYYSKEEDGLKQQWNGVCWMNPPYGRAIGQWMEKAVKSMLGGGDCGVPYPGKDGYKMVAQMGNAICLGDQVPCWTTEVWKCRNISTVSISNRHIQARKNTSNQSL